MHPVTFDLVLERVAHRVPALERGQQRRVGVDGAAAERVDEGLRQDRAEAGDRDEVDLVTLQCVDHFMGVRDPVEVGAERRTLDQLDRDPGARGDLHRAAWPVDDENRDRQPALCQRSQDRSAAGCKDPDPHAVHGIEFGSSRRPGAGKITAVPPL